MDQELSAPAYDGMVGDIVTLVEQARAGSSGLTMAMRR